jgi:sigma-54 dependent transcriptional regulator, acetoin dehydrogenase operon transcriptional activator AcoR
MARVVEFEPRPKSRAAVLKRPAVVASWHERARQLGLHEGWQPDFAAISRTELTRLAEQNRSLYLHALPVMETLHEQILNTHSMVILTDASGMILHTLGDADFLERAERVALRPGVAWSELSKGTNAIGTALTEQRPTLVHGSEHFLTVNRFLTCSCSPIQDPHGRLIGALDVSGAKESYHAHTMALVRMSTQLIENHLFVDRFSETVRIHFHLRPEFLGTIAEGIAAFDAGGRCVAANSAGLAQLGVSGEALRSYTLPSLFGITLGALIDLTGRPGAELVSLCLQNGVRVSARAHFNALPSRTSAPGITPAKPAQEAARHAPTRGYTLEELDLGEPAIARVIQQVRRVQRHAIPILIHGETGTGKEVLARAIHAASPRSGKPFVAVDCAAIPDSLIEAELFGYEEGAFTGARRRGHRGKIVSADGGTLFLDEIGDMPSALQTRLLRVLQERVITPLGGSKPLAVDVAVICATHRDLRERIGRGQFREDLYYRLNGLTVRLPALRERSDLAALIRDILERQRMGAASAQVSASVLELFRTYRWPGNVRQLANVLRTAAAMAESGVIAAEHLSEDFLEDLRRDGPRSEPATAAAQSESVALVPARAAAAESESGGGSLRSMQAGAIRKALDECAGNVSAAARALGVSRNTIYRALRAQRP